MKKIFLAVVMILALAVSGVAGAAPNNGSLLNDEEKIAVSVFNAFNGQGTYTENVNPYATAGLKKQLSGAKFKETQTKIKDAFGKMSNMKLFVLQKFDKADRLIYIAQGTKSPAVELTFTFDTTSKVLVDAFALRPVEVKKTDNK